MACAFSYVVARLSHHHPASVQLTAGNETQWHFITSDWSTRFTHIPVRCFMGSALSSFSLKENQQRFAKQSFAWHVAIRDCHSLTHGTVSIVVVVVVVFLSSTNSCCCTALSTTINSMAQFRSNLNGSLHSLTLAFISIVYLVLQSRRE